MDTRVAALEGVRALVGIRRQRPGIGGVVLPCERRVLEVLEVLRQRREEVEVPPHVHQAVALNALDIGGLGADVCRSDEQLVHDEVDMVGLLVVDHVERKLVRGLGVLVACHRRNGVAVVAGVDLAFIVAVLVGGEGVGLRLAELVRAGDGDGDTADRRGLVLLVHVAANSAVAAHPDLGRVRHRALALVVHGGHVEDVAVLVVHVVGQHVLRDGVARDNLVEGSLVDQLAVHVDAVATVGTVLDGLPRQRNGLLVFEDTRVAGLQVRGHVQARREAEHGTGGHALVLRARVAALLDAPEVVRVVPQSDVVRDAQALLQLAAPLADVGGRVVRLVLRIVGAAEDDTPLVGIVVQRPAQRQVVLRDVVGVVLGIDAGHGLDRARQLLEVDRHLEVLASGGGNQVIGAGQHVQVEDLGASAVAIVNDGLNGFIRNGGTRVDGNVVNENHILVIGHMMEGNPHVLASVIAQVNRFLIPCRKTVVQIGNLTSVLSIASTASAIVPNGSEVGSARCFSSGNANLHVVHVSITQIIMVESEAGVVTKSISLRRNEIVVLIKAAIAVYIREGKDKVIRFVVAIASSIGEHV